MNTTTDLITEALTYIGTEGARLAEDHGMEAAQEWAAKAYAYLVATTYLQARGEA